MNVRLVFISVVLLLCGCVTRRSLVFEGRVENLTGDNWKEEGMRGIGSQRQEPSEDGGRLLSLSLDDTQFLLRHPTPDPGKLLHARASNSGLRAWLIRPPYLETESEPLPLAKQLEENRAVPLNGELELIWRDNMDFTLRVHVRGDGPNPITIAGVFKVDQQTEFEPLWLVPPVLTARSSLSVATSPTLNLERAESDIRKHLKRGDLRSLDQWIKPFMETRRRRRSFDVEIPARGESVSFSNATGLTDKAGVELHTPLPNSRQRVATLKLICQKQNIHLKEFPLRSGGSYITIEIYGDPETVTKKARIILGEGFEIGETSPLDFLRTQ